VHTAVTDKYKDTFVAALLLSYLTVLPFDCSGSVIYEPSTMIASPITLIKLVQILINVLTTIADPSEYTHRPSHTQQKEHRIENIIK
jgi:hypothetical protein